MPHHADSLQASSLNLPRAWRLAPSVPLGGPFGLTILGVNLTRLALGAWSMVHRQHEQQDDSIYVLEGEPVLVTDAVYPECAPASQRVVRPITWKTVATATPSSWRSVIEAGARECVPRR
jgi:hypothetical protein